MRCDQPMGLNAWARDLLESQDVKVLDKTTRIFPDGKEVKFEMEKFVSEIKSEQYDTYEGFDEHPLYKHTFPDGRIYFEFLQASPWYSGPVMFLALKDEQGNEIKESLWTEEEMREYL